MNTNEYKDKDEYVSIYFHIKLKLFEMETRLYTILLSSINNEPAPARIAGTIVQAKPPT